MPEHLSVHDVYVYALWIMTPGKISDKNQAFEMLYVIHGQSVE